LGRWTSQSEYDEALAQALAKWLVAEYRRREAATAGAEGQTAPPEPERKDDMHAISRGFRYA
jgi:hypothetical protein